MLIADDQAEVAPEPRCGILHCLFEQFCVRETLCVVTLEDQCASVHVDPLPTCVTVEHQPVGQIQVDGEVIVVIVC